MMKSHSRLAVKKQQGHFERRFSPLRTAPICKCCFLRHGSALTRRLITHSNHFPILGRCLLAQVTDREVIVYQAYKPELGTFATEHSYFGGGFSFQRTSWIKPNFTWMMHRCGWATKQDQEVRGAEYRKYSVTGSGSWYCSVHRDNPAQVRKVLSV